MARTNISVDQQVFEEFSSQAERQNKTLFAFANESLMAIANISAEGGNPSDLVKLWRTVSLLKQIDVITLPSDFIDQLIGRLYAVDKASLLRLFQDLGKELVGVLKIAAEDLDRLEELARDFIALLPLKQCKIIKLDSSTIEIGIVGAGRKIESTECSLEFLKSILNGYGYTPTKIEINIGTIRLWASKRGSM
jgi:hypothetical protein